MAAFTTTRTRNIDFGTVSQIDVRGNRCLRPWHALLDALHAGLAQAPARGASGRSGDIKPFAGLVASQLEQMCSSYERPRSYPRPAAVR